MRVPKPRKLRFIQLRLGGESVSVTELTEKQCIKTAQLVKAEYLAGKRGNAARDNITLAQAIDKYVGSRSNILSPSTLRGYNTINDEISMLFRAVYRVQIPPSPPFQKPCSFNDYRVFEMAEKEGFEPSRAFDTPTPLAGEPLRPLGYFSTCGQIFANLINRNNPVSRKPNPQPGNPPARPFWR